MALPWLIGAAVVAAAGALASSSNDDYDECRKCSRREYKDSLCEKHYAEKEAENLKEDIILEDINLFKSKSIDMIERKYKQKITFTGQKLEIIEDDNSIFQELKNRIEILNSDNEEMKELIKQLEEAKNVI